MIHDKQTTGFTLIELMLAMAFVTGLLLAIAVTSIQIMGTYTKGLTTREVNQVGRVISEDMQKSIATSIPFKVYPVKAGDVSDDPSAADSGYVRRPGGGRLCIGDYTYAWNYGNTRQLSASAVETAYNTYSDDPSAIRFIKVRDAGALLCADPSRQIEKTQAKELLSVGDGNLAIQSFTVNSARRDEASGQALYAVSFVLGTNDQTQLTSSSHNCLPPSEGDGAENFCAINQFDIIVRAGNRSGSL